MTEEHQEAAEPEVHIDEMPAVFSLEWRKFTRWWKRRGHESTAPTYHEWLAQFIEWHKIKRRRRR